MTGRSNFSKLQCRIAGQAQPIEALPAADCEVGMVATNRGSVSNPAAPFGGVRSAGLGREGIHDYNEIRYAALAA